MNIRSHLIEIQCNHRDINDVAQALVHSIVFFRTHGKFNYKHEGSYSIGTLGFERAFCDHLDFNYVRCSSLPLVNRINNKIQEFVDKINDYTHSGTLALEFYTKRPSRWPFNDSKIVWELWNIRILIAPNEPPMAANHTINLPAGSAATNIIMGTSPGSPHSLTYNMSGGEPTHHHHHHQHHNININMNFHSDAATRLEDLLSQKILDIIKIVNGDKCSLPQMPTQPNLDTVFDTSFNDLQPYLYNLSYKISETAPGSHSVHGGTTTKYSDGATVTDNTTQSSLKKFLLGTLEL